MKVIFLDFDGVINNSLSYENGVYILPEKVVMVRDIVEKTGAHIVVSSTWRKMYSIGQLNMILTCAGLNSLTKLHLTHMKSEEPIYDITDDRGPSRGKEISRWIEQKKFFYPNLKYVILDDDGDMLPEQLPYFVQTQWEFGLLPEHVEKAIDILNK